MNEFWIIDGAPPLRAYTNKEYAEKHASTRGGNLIHAMAREWQPIETAPKDGSRILIYSGSIDIAFWINECWMVVDCDDPFYVEYKLPDDVSHWMPLPEPPK